MAFCDQRLSLTVTLMITFGVVFSHLKSNPQEMRMKTAANEDLKTTVIKRCHIYIKVHPWLKKNCTKIWDAFNGSFAEKNCSSITTDDYRKFIELANHDVGCGKSMLWSGTKEIVHKYTHAIECHMTLEDTLIGYLADGLQWCENATDPVTVFWKAASENFANITCGKVHVMLKDSNGSAFSNRSIFRSVEVPRLNGPNVSNVTIWMINHTE
ncbi:ADP-ribosyl cyclase/cyclic ADP-ribose hydrolase 1-like [Latimeria chalumnae]|uniref:ADP-ribosyl cyclase/cyclic ADP-ribose hydrolase 1-like n=1 Tax=Latimeria chalumnae TaxID=7897 RepID=UPI00313D2D64